MKSASRVEELKDIGLCKLFHKWIRKRKLDGSQN